MLYSVAGHNGDEDDEASRCDVTVAHPRHLLLSDTSSSPTTKLVF